MRNSFLHFQTLLNPESGYIKDDTIKLEVLVMADAPHGVQFVLAIYLYLFASIMQNFVRDGHIFSFFTLYGHQNLSSF